MVWILTKSITTTKFLIKGVGGNKIMSTQQAAIETIMQQAANLSSEDKKALANHLLADISEQEQNNHLLVVNNILKFLKLNSSKSIDFGNNIKFKISGLDHFVCADVGIICGESLFENMAGHKVLTNPVLLAEVTMNALDYGDNEMSLGFYQQIESLKEYLIIRQYQPFIAQYVKQEDGTWQGNEVTGLDSEIYLPSINCRLPLREVYQNVLA